MLDFTLNQLTSTSAVASVIAAVVAIFLAVWTVTRDLRDKGKLRIDCGYSFNPLALKSGASGEPFIPVFRITNVGRQPVTVKEIQLVFRHPKVRVSWEYKNLPRILTPSEFVVEQFEYDFDKTPVTKVIVIDSHGKEWRAARMEVKKLLERPKDEHVKTGGSSPPSPTGS